MAYTPFHADQLDWGSVVNKTIGDRAASTLVLGSVINPTTLNLPGESTITAKNLNVTTTTTVNQLEVNSDAVVTDDLTVNGNVTLGDNAGVDTLAIKANTTWYTDDPTPAATLVITHDGNIATPGTLDVNGVVNLGVSGVATTVEGSLTVNQTSTLTGAVTITGVLDINNSATIAGTLALDATTSTLTVGADDTNNNTATIYGDVVVGSTTNQRDLTVRGNITHTNGTFNSNNGNLTVNATTVQANVALDVNAAADISGTLTLSKTTGVGLLVMATAEINKSFTVLETTTLFGALNVYAVANISDTLTLSKASGTGLAVTANATIGGDLNVTGNLVVGGTQTFQGGAIFNGNIAFGDQATDVITFYGALKVNNGQPTPTDVFVVSPTTGNTSIAGTLTVTGQTTLNAQVNLGGHLIPTTDSTYNIGDISHRINNFYATNLIATATEIGGTKLETFVIDSDNTGGNLSLIFGTANNQRLTWDATAGEFQLTNNLNVSGNAAVSGTATITGITTLNGAVDINATADISNTLTLSKASGTGLAVTANATIGGTVTVAGMVNVNAAADISDTLTLSKASGTGLNVISNVTVGGTLEVTGAAMFNGNTILGNAFSDTLTIYSTVAISDGAPTPSNTFTIDPTTGNTVIAGNVDIGAGLDVTGNITVTGTVDGEDIALNGTRITNLEDGTNWVFGELAAETPNGTITNFHMVGNIAYQSGKVAVSWDGQRVYDFTEDADRKGITFGFAPAGGEIRFDYIKETV